MAKIFEDEFMEIQSEIISLCLELCDCLEKPVTGLEKIYPYVSIEDSALYSNVYYVINGEVKRPEEFIGIENCGLGGLCSRFRREETKLVRELIDVWYKHNQKRVPYEIKMCYDVKSGGFEATYAHDPVIPPDDDELMPEHLFRDWREEIKAQLKKG